MSLLDTQESELDTDPSTSDASEVYLPQYLPLEIVG